MPGGPDDEAESARPAGVAPAEGEADWPEGAEPADTEGAGDRRPRSSSAKVLGGAMLGVGALFGPKADPSEHWSASPKVTIVQATRAESRSPLELDDTLVPDAPPPPASAPTRRRRRWFRRR